MDSSCTHRRPVPRSARVPYSVTSVNTPITQHTIVTIHLSPYVTLAHDPHVAPVAYNPDGIAIPYMLDGSPLFSREQRPALSWAFRTSEYQVISPLNPKIVCRIARLAKRRLLGIIMADELESGYPWRSSMQKGMRSPSRSDFRLTARFQYFGSEGCRLSQDIQLRRDVFPGIHCHARFVASLLCRSCCASHYR